MKKVHGVLFNITIQATIVTSYGKVLTASQTENEDLFWAIRGGGGNFGVVTEFVFQLHEQCRNIYSGTMMFSADLLDQLVDITADWCKARSPKASMLQTLRRGPSPDYAPYIEVIPFYNGGVEEGREVFKAFLDLSKLNSDFSVTLF